MGPRVDGYGTDGYGVKDTGQMTKIPRKKKKFVDSTPNPPKMKIPEMGDGSGVPVSKATLANEKKISDDIRKKLGLMPSQKTSGLAESLNKK